MVRVEGLDLQEELGHVREAAKMAVGEVLVDLRQARKGLRQVKGELQRVRDDEDAKSGEKKEHGDGDDGTVARAVGAGAVVCGGQTDKKATNLAASVGSAAAAAASAAPGRLSVVEEGSERSTSTTTTSSSSSSTCSSLPLPAESSETAAGVGGTPGVRKLSAFVEKAEVRLLAIERSANACVGLCKDLGEYFGEGADEAQSHHIFRTLVQFLDLLQEAKKAEGLC